MSEPTTEPQSLRAGDAVAWTRDLPDYPPGTWTLKYRILWQTPPAKDITAAAAGGALHRVDLASATTLTYPAGIATLVGWVESGATKRTLLQQPLQVLPDLTSATSLDGRSDNLKALAAARAALLAYLQGGKAHVAEYEIAGRRMRFRDVDQIQALVEHYERQVARDNAAAALAQGVAAGRIYTRF